MRKPLANCVNMRKTTNKEKTLKPRIDFERGVPETLFKRAGGHCSVPRCKTPAMGPFYDASGAVNMGMACHIFSAAENGPRGRSGKDVKFISSAENGLWCCAYHGNLIDKGKGKDYPAEMLFAWKKLAEARVTKRLNDVPSPLGWVDTIEFTHFARRPRLPKLTLSRNTLLAGGNGAGKSVLLEAAASISNSSAGERFAGAKVRASDDLWEPALFRAELVYSTVDHVDKKITVEIRDDILSRTEGTMPCLLAPGDIEVILVSDLILHRKNGEDDVDFFLRTLHIDKTAFLGLAKLGVKSIMPGEITFREAVEWDDDGNSIPIEKSNGDPYVELLIRRDGRERPASFAGLSGSEKVRLIVDMYISKAREVCKQRLTLLLIDDFVANLDDSNFANLLTKLSQEDFQSVVVLPSAREAHIATQTETGLVLKDLDYLRSWRIYTVDAFPFGK